MKSSNKKNRRIKKKSELELKEIEIKEIKEITTEKELEIKRINQLQFYCFKLPFENINSF